LVLDGARRREFCVRNGFEKLGTQVEATESRLGSAVDSTLGNVGSLFGATAGADVRRASLPYNSKGNEGKWYGAIPLGTLLCAESRRRRGRLGGTAPG
jgi:hypothetical protein